MGISTEFENELKNSKSTGTLSLRLSNGGRVDAVIVTLLPTADGGGIILGANGSDNVRLGHPKLPAGTHTVTFSSGDAGTSIKGVSYTAETGEMTLTVDDPLTTAKGTFKFTTEDGIDAEGEFDIKPV